MVANLAGHRYLLTVSVAVARVGGAYPFPADQAALQAAAGALAAVIPGGRALCAWAGNEPDTITVVVEFRHDGGMEAARAAATARTFGLVGAAQGVAEAAGGRLAGTRVVSVTAGTADYRPATT